MKIKLQNAIKLACRLTVYVPATVNVNEQIDNRIFVDATAKLLSTCFGGATSTHAVGYWQSTNGELVHENTTLVFAYCTQADLQLHIDGIYKHCQQLREQMKQEAIALEVNGEMYLI